AADVPPEESADMVASQPTGHRWPTWLLVILGVVGAAGVTILLLALLTNIFERKQEARQTFVRLVEVTEDTTDPKVWGQNWPAEYDSYLKTALATTTKYGGRGPGASDHRPAGQKLHPDPRLPRVLARHPFASHHRPLPRPPGPLLRAVRPGADAAGDREEAARGLHPVPRLEPPPLPLRREGRRPEGVRAGLGHALRGGPEPEGRPGPDPGPALALVRGLPRPEDDGRAGHPPRL